jgi:thiamine phosphate synthase YjbQ (UPF0047 family)
VSANEPRPPAPTDAFEQVTIEAQRDEAALEIGDRIRPLLRRAVKPDGLIALALESPYCSLALADDVSGALEDLLAALEKIAPKNEYYQSNLRAPTERSGAARVRAALLPRSLLLPYRARLLLLPEGVTPIVIRHDPRQSGLVIISLMIY